MKQYRIADIHIGMDTYGVTEVQSRPWLTDQPVSTDLEIPVAPFPLPDDPLYSEKSLKEYARTGLMFSKGLLDHNGFLFHASAICFDGKAYCFCGPSGAGKSTHAALWQQKFGNERVRVINDDKPAIRLIDDKWFVYGTPWSGKTDQSINMSAELNGIFIIIQDRINTIQMIPDFQKVGFLASFISGPMSGIERAKALTLLDRLIASVPVYGLRCRPDTEAVETVLNAIKTGEGEQI